MSIEINRVKTLAVTDNDMHIWADYNKNICGLHVTDEVYHVTHDMAEYCCGKYKIQNLKYFNDYFIPAIKKKPRIMLELFEFIEDLNRERDDLYVIKMRWKCFRRRLNIIVIRGCRKTKRFFQFKYGF